MDDDQKNDSANQSNYGGSKELAELLEECVIILNRHLSLPLGATVAIALWVAFAHAIDAAEFSPRLAFVSPLPECGKTTALQIINLLCPKPMPTSNTTPAVIFRLIEAMHPTLIIDEADTFLDTSNEIAGILNSGHARPMAYVMRCAKDNKKDFVPQRFSTWAPIVIAKIGRLPPALESRSIIIHMQRALPGEPIKKVDVADRERIEVLAKQLAKLIPTILGELKRSDPIMPDVLSNRVADNWRTMFALADLVGGVWPERARESAVQLSGPSEPADAVQLLSAMRTIFQKHGHRISSVGFCDYLSKADDEEDKRQYTPRTLASALKPFGIKPKSVRIDDKTPKGYEYSQFEATFERYVDTSDETKDA